MAIFGKKPESTDRQSPSESARRSRGGSSADVPGPSVVTKAASFLGPGCALEGEFRGKGSVECRGRFHGSLEVEGDVIVGRGGKALARLSARRILIEGHLEGDAVGSEKVEVGATGHVEGDVRAPAVMFQEGAFFEGNVEMNRGRAGGKTDSDAAGEEGAASDTDARTSGG